MKAPSELGANGTFPPQPPATPRKKSRFWRNLGLLCLLAIAGGATYATLTPEGRGIVEGGKAIVAVQQNPNLLFDNAKSDRVNILLIGRDVNWKETKVF